MSTPSAENTLSVTVPGAFELYEGNLEKLDTLTRNGSLLQPGDTLPAIPGVDAGKPFILHAVNALGTETCDSCVGELEAWELAHPDIPVVTITKQSPEEIQAEADKRAAEGKKPITQRVISIDNTTAINLGVALAPGENADKEFWPTALRRTLGLIGMDGTVLAIDQPDDQEQKPDFGHIYDMAEDFGATKR